MAAHASQIQVTGLAETVRGRRSQREGRLNELTVRHSELVPPRGPRRPNKMRRTCTCRLGCTGVPGELGRSGGWGTGARSALATACAIRKSPWCSRRVGLCRGPGKPGSSTSALWFCGGPYLGLRPGGRQPRLPCFALPASTGSSTSALRNLRALARPRPVAERNSERAEVAKGRRPAARRRLSDMERGRGLYALWNGREVDNDKVFDRWATVCYPAGHGRIMELRLLAKSRDPPSASFLSLSSVAPRPGVTGQVAPYC